MCYNIENCHQNNVDTVLPQTEICDENWAIDCWMKPHMLGMRKIAEYHGFIVQMHDFGVDADTKKQMIVVSEKYNCTPSPTTPAWH